MDVMLGFEELGGKHSLAIGNMVPLSLIWTI